MRRLGLLGGSFLLACLGCNEVTGGSDSQPDDPSDPVAEAPQPIVAEKVDLLLVVDNSISMADKQAILAPSAVKLVRDLTDPPCLDANGARLPDADQPASPADACPAGSARASSPVSDLRVGVISSSLGALTANQCDSAVDADPSKNDGARLLTRGPGGVVVPTYQNLGFLAWDPAAIQSPPGDTVIEDFEDKLAALITGVGEVGCGYEMPLEAMARFLVDPAPYQSLANEEGFLVAQGVDTVLLEQRASFLRPDSLVSVILLADENDCSVNVSSQGYLAFDSPAFYKSTSVCQADPNDACCTSCALQPPAGCAPDPACGAQGTSQAAKYDVSEDHPNTRCWDQKRRYGIDFRYPVARYTNALTQPLIDPSQPDLAAAEGQGVANPLFAGDRPIELVSLTTIVGVPWQDVAIDPTNPASPIKTSSQMEYDGSWAWLVEGVDPFMRESIGARTGTNPATGEDVSVANGINGGERTVPGNEDLQYACIFGLEAAIPNGPDCSGCVDASCDEPLCDGETQIAAKAYPGVRQLSVVRSLGDRGIAGSICPGALTTDPMQGGPSVRSTGYDPPIVELESRMWTYLPRE